MKQFLEKESDAWNITLLIKVPLHKFKKEFNFRIKSIEKVDGKIILDPILSSSKYIFSIKNNMLGKIMYFNFKFSLKEIQDIKSFTFGFCDEMVSWLPKSIFSVENEFLKTEEYRALFDLKKDTSVLEDFSVINTPKPDDNN